MKKPVFSEINRLNKLSDYQRTGQLSTRNGVVFTPTFMPVGTRGTVKGLEPAVVADTGAQVVLANAYHLHLQPGEQTINKLGGIHKFTKWAGPILTDSGGFQIFSLAHSRKITEDGVHFIDPKTGDKAFISPEISMQIQFALGSDIIMAFDDLTGLDPGARNRTKDAVERTHRWLIRCIAEFNRLSRTLPVKKRPLLFGILQGGLDEKLRLHSLDFVQSQKVDGVAIGGLSVGETRAEMHSMLDYLAPHFDPLRPRYLMGVGDPIDFRYAIARGIDMMDCVMPTRNARHGTVWITGDKKLNLKNAEFIEDKSVIDRKCDCRTCKTGYSRGFLRHQFKMGDSLAGSLASIHNLRYLQRICEEARA